MAKATNGGKNKAPGKKAEPAKSAPAGKNVKKSPAAKPAKTPPATSSAKTVATRAPGKTGKPQAKVTPAVNNKSQTKSAPAKSVQAKAPAKTTPVKSTPAKAAPAKTTPAKAAPAKTTSAKAAPAKTTPTKAAPAKTGGKNSSTKTKARSKTTVKAASSVLPVTTATTTVTSGGLGIRITRRKPGLSVPTRVLILGKTNTGKTGTPENQTDRQLSKKDLTAIRFELVERRDRLLTGMRRELAIQRERADSKAADEVDKAADAYDEDLSFEIATANDQELGDIQAALDKIEKGTYGVCEVCGEHIAPSRLKILPSATTCVDCRGQEEMARQREDGNLSFTMVTDEFDESEAGET